MPVGSGFAGLKLGRHAYQVIASESALDANVSVLGLDLNKVSPQLHSGSRIDAHPKRSGVLEDDVRELVGAVRFA